GLYRFAAVILAAITIAVMVHVLLRPKPSGRIAYVSSAQRGAYFLSLIDVDGSHPQPLVSDAFGTQIAVSPDGTKIAYNTPGPELHVAHVDGSGSRTVSTRRPGSTASWSSDSRQLAF